jgi:hypothetical protein
MTNEGELYILETNIDERVDEIFNIKIIGAGFSRAENVFNKYNKIAVRRLHNIFRVPELGELTLQFANKNRGSRFPSTGLPFLSVWLGVPLGEKDVQTNEMFCSELMAHYYTYTIGPLYQKVTGMPFNGKLSTLFGTGAPSTEDMFTPGHYTFNNTPNASIFVGNEEIIHTIHADILYVILQPFLIILVIMLAIWMALPNARTD